MQLSPKPNHVDVNRLSIHYHKDGDGPPMLLLHGLGKSSATWDENIESLAKYFSVYTLDLPWFRESPPTLLSYEKLTQYAETISTLLSKLEIDRAHLVGISIGGVLAAIVVQRHPEKVHRLVLINAVGLLEGTLALRWHALDSERLRDLERQTLLQRSVLIITGESDSSIQRDAVCFLAGRNPLARCVIVPDAGALPHEERAEAVNRQIISFCAEMPVNTFCG